jgi:hypothetical protein
VQQLTVAGRAVFISEYHHDILNAWAEIRRGRQSAFGLITFDFHTDTLPAFKNHAYRLLELALRRAPVSDEDHVKVETERERLVKAVDFADPVSIKHAAAKLRHDEHIDCALRAGILSRVAVVLSTDVPGNTRDIATLLPAERTCEHGECDASCLAELAAGMLESRTLGPKLSAVAAAWGGLGEYVVDIDLDFFRSAAASSPNDAAVFHALLRGAVAITIARESRCVTEGRLSGEMITADGLQASLLVHIERALFAG